MQLKYVARFKKQFAKLPPKQQGQFAVRLKLFLSDRTNPVLRVHPLKGSYAGYWSMNISGDLRAIFIDRGDEIIIFALIGTHRELYGWLPL